MDEVLFSGLALTESVSATSDPNSDTLQKQADISHLQHVEPS